MEPKHANIWEEALREKAQQPAAQAQQRILILLGQPNSGKSTLVKILKNQADSDSKPTYLLEYSYVRRGFTKKQLIHCYDIAAKTQTDILPSLFSKDTFASVTVALCLDLSRPASIIPQVQHWISTLQKEIDLALQEKPGLQEKYAEWLSRRRQETNKHEDCKLIVTPPVNLVLVGCKYDIFEKYETENRKWLSKALRYLAHTYGASLTFASSKNPQLSSQARSFMLELMFEERPKVVIQRDHLKPIFVLRGQDSLNNIGVPASGSVSGIEVLRRQLSGLFQEDEEKKREGIDPAKYIESKVDGLLTDRKKQLAKIGKKKNGF